MAYSRNPPDFDRSVELLEQALASERGIRIICGPKAGATKQTFRLNEARAKIRAENREIYEFGHELHGRSPYEHFSIRVRPSADPETWYCEIVPLEVFAQKVEEL